MSEFATMEPSAQREHAAEAEAAMRLFTVILQRPDYIRVDDDHARVQLIGVRARAARNAAEAAQRELASADDATVHDDYLVLYVFEGSIEPALYGWQL